VVSKKHRTIRFFLHRLIRAKSTERSVVKTTDSDHGTTSTELSTDSSRAKHRLIPCKSTDSSRVKAPTHPVLKHRPSGAKSTGYSVLLLRMTGAKAWLIPCSPSTFITAQPSLILSPKRARWPR
jgi:hypothetical protein